jgi:diacylglycerol kinase (ATP)
VMRNIILIGNPIAGGGAFRMIRAAEATLKKRGFTVEVMLTSKRGDAESFARIAANRAETLVIAAGGDGTYNEVANGLVYSETPLAILPLGTTSVLARELDIPLKADKALDVALDGRIETVNMGLITYRPVAENTDSDDKPGNKRHFLLMAGIGIDANAVYGVNVRLKKFSGRVAYILSGLKALFNYRPEKLEIDAALQDHDDIRSGNFHVHPDYVTLTENRLKTKGYITIISKASCYGGNFSITPDADLKEPFLYTLTLHKKGKASLIRLFIAIVTGRPLASSDISYFRAKEIIINGSGRMQIDGDYAGRAPVKIEVVKDALKLVVPK